MNSMKYTNVGGPVLEEPTAEAKYVKSTTHGVPPEIHPKMNGDQLVFSVL